LYEDFKKSFVRWDSHWNGGGASYLGSQYRQLGLPGFDIYFIDSKDRNKDSQE